MPPHIFKCPLGGGWVIRQTVKTTLGTGDYSSANQLRSVGRRRCTLGSQHPRWEFPLETGGTKFTHLIHLPPSMAPPPFCPRRTRREALSVVKPCLDPSSKCSVKTISSWPMPHSKARKKGVPSGSQGTAGPEDSDSQPCSPTF